MALVWVLRTSFVAAAMCVALAAAAGTDTWTSMGPFGRGVVRLVEDPDDPSRLYADAFDPYRLYRSRNAGKDWSPAASPPSENVDEYQSYFPGNGAIYAIGFASTAWKSVDGGFSWDELPPPPYDLHITVSEPGNPQVVYGIAFEGAVKSSDGGSTWTMLGTGVPDAGGWAGMLIDTTSPPTVYIYGPSSILKSTDAGANWNPVPTGLGLFSVSAMMQYGPTLLVATYNQGFLRSVDGGATWLPSNGGLADPRIYRLAKGPGATPVIYATAGPPDWPALLRSVDGGNTWTPTGAAGIDHVVVSRHTQNRLYGVTFGTVAVSDDAGVTWAIDSYASGLPNVVTSRLFLDAGGTSVLYAMTDGTPGGIRSADRGRTWAPITLPLEPVSASRTQPGTVYALAPQDALSARRSVDFGVSWTPLGIVPDIRVNAIEEAPSDPRTLYVAGARDCGSTAHVPKYCDVVQRSVDGGVSWIDVSQGLPGGGLSGLTVAPTDARTVFVGTGAHVYATTDGGATWTDRSAGLSGGRIRALAPNPSDAATVYAGLGSSFLRPVRTDAGLYVTTDGGASWSARNEGLPAADVTALAIDPADPTILYAGVAGLGVFRTADGGMHWAPFGAGLGGDASLTVNSIAIDPRDSRNVYVGTDGGAYALTYVDYGAVGHAIEFYEPEFDHYFIATETQPDVIALDSAVIPGWSRTGRAFAVYPFGAPGTSRVCRFFSGQTFAPKSSHFYTPYAAECSALRQGRVWQYEGDAFALTLPVGAPGFGGCPPGSAPLYRLYNDGQGGAPNHRYTDELALLNQMVAQGWVFEGEATTKVFACVPAVQ